MKPRYALHTFVNRILLRRIIFVCLMASLLIGGIAWFQVRHQAANDAVQIALNRVALISTRYAHLRQEGVSREAAVYEAIEGLQNIEFDASRGRFVSAVFYDELGDFHVSADSTFADFASARLIVGDDRSLRPDFGAESSEIVSVEGQPAVHVVVPIAGPEGNLAAWVSAVYLLSPDAASELKSAPLLAVGSVLLIVWVITAMLYPVILQLARRLADYSSSLLEANLEMMEALGCAIAKRDGDTDAHNYRVTIYSVRLAEREGLSLKAIQGLIKGAFLHDIGKIGIRDDVLLKPGRLSDEEYTVMKTHVEHGLEIVGRARWLHDALDVVGAHHEKFDGQGYPKQIPGKMIPTAARIFAIADVFDALSSKRPYKEALPLTKVIAIMEEGRATHFDPDLLSAFLRLAPDLHAEMVGMDASELRQELYQLNERYFASRAESLFV